MDTVTISPKFQVVIPKSIRKRLKLVPGQKVQAIAYDERIEFIPIRSARELRGILRGLDTSFERTCQLKGEATALEAAAVMLQGRVVELSANLALDAARLSGDSGLAMADSIILATARSEDAVLWTQDAHFDGLEKVEFRERQETAG